MKRKTLGLALLVVTAFAMPSFAQNSDTPDVNTKVCTENPVCKDKGVRPCDLCEFSGLDLTDSQKSELKALQDKYMKKAGESKKEFDKQKRDRAKKDREAMRKQREADKKAYLADVKKILGPEKYVEFLEKNYNPRPNGKKMMRKQGRPEGPEFQKGVKQSKRFDKNAKAGKGKKSGRKGGGNKEYSSK